MKLRKWEWGIIGLVLMVGMSLCQTVLPSRSVADEDPRVGLARAAGYCDFFGYQVLTPNSTTASSLTVPTGATCAEITFETANVRAWWNGTAPTTSYGHLLGPTGQGVLLYLSNSGQLNKFKVISVLALGTLMIQYGK